MKIAKRRRTKNWRGKKETNRRRKNKQRTK
jgi:hypothetical protein